MKRYLRIGELASQMGLNPKTIRYYEELGILNPVRGGNGYRFFPVEDAAQLRFVLRAKKFGLTLTEIKGLLDYARSNRCGTVKSSLRKLVRERIAEIDARMQELADLRKDLQSFIQGDQEGLETDPSPDGDCACI